MDQEVGSPAMQPCQDAKKRRRLNRVIEDSPSKSEQQQQVRKSCSVTPLDARVLPFSAAQFLAWRRIHAPGRPLYNHPTLTRQEATVCCTNPA